MTEVWRTNTDGVLQVTLRQNNGKIGGRCCRVRVSCRRLVMATELCKAANIDVCQLQREMLIVFVW